MQIEPGGIAQVVGMARDFVQDESLVVVLGDNIFERSQSDAIAAWAGRAGRAQIFVKEVPDPENFGVVAYDGDGHVTDIVEKAGVVDTRYAEPPSQHAVVGLYCFPPDVFEVIEALEPSSRGELEITDVNRHYAVEGRLDVVEVERLVGGRREALGHLAEIGRRVEETGANDECDGHPPHPAAPVRGRAWLVLRAPARQRAAAPDACRRTCASRARA